MTDWVSSAISGGAGLGSSLMGGMFGSASAKKDRSQRAQQFAEQLAFQKQQMEQQQKQFGLSLGQRQTEFGQTFGAQQDRQAALQKAYFDAQQRGGQMSAEAEAALMESLNTPSEHLAQQEKDILSGQAVGMQQASGQMGANLAQQGVRGGQAATQMRRGMGEMGIAGQKEVNKLKYEDEQRRQAQLRAYQQSKAGAGMSAQFQPAYF